jgi:hypothetical protein
MSSVFDQVSEFARLLPLPSRDPVPGRLEVGSVAHARLTDAARPPAEERPWERPVLSALYGLPIVPSATMDPLAWRILDTDGKVVGSGLMEVPGPAWWAERVSG